MRRFTSSGITARPNPGCTGKVAFSTYHRADVARRFATLHHPVQAYPCDTCQAFHLGGRVRSPEPYRRPAGPRQVNGEWRIAREVLL